MSFSRHQTFTIAGLVAVSAMTGWWSGAAGRTVPGPVAAVSLTETGAPSGPDHNRNGASSADAGPAGDGSSEAEITAAREELLALINGGMEESQQPNRDMLGLLRKLARGVCLYTKLPKEDQEELTGQVPEEHRGEVAMLLKTFGGIATETDSSSGSDFATELSAATEDFVRIPVISKWAAADPAGFLAYWKGEVIKPDAPAWVKAMSSAFVDIAQADPQLLMREAMTMQDPELRRIMLGNLSPLFLYAGSKNQWSAEKDTILKQLMNELPDRREIHLGRVLSARLKNESPDETRAWVSSLDLGADSAEWTDKAFFNSWRGEDRTAAAQWMLDHTVPQQRADSIADYVGWWTNANVPKDQRQFADEPDIAGCADWILSLGIGPDTDKGISVLADGWIQAGEPAAALAWAQSISDEATRASCLEKVTTQIERRYPDTWRAMLSAAGLPH